MGAVVIVGAALAAIIASSWPIVGTWFEDELPEVARPGIARAIRARGWAMAPPGKPRAHRVFGPDVDLDVHPDIPELIPTAPRGEPITGAIVRPKAPLELREEADPRADVVAKVTPKDTLLVVREVGRGCSSPSRTATPSPSAGPPARRSK